MNDQLHRHTARYPVQGAGLGLRRPLADKLMANPPTDVDFMEVAPENWIHVGGNLGKKLRFFTERYPFVIHGLSLSIGAPSPLNEQLVRDIKDFMAARVRRVQDILEQRMALENVSFYAPIDTSMSEREFLLAVLEEADCDLMLDINNIVVNSINHRYDASEFLNAMPAERIRYFHLAGHFVQDEDLRIDTHGSPVDAQAWALLEEAYTRFGPVPTLLERDFNFPPMDELLDEVRRIKQLQIESAGQRAAHG
jgi:uncharacterized protein (UPF0276 family)